MEEWSDGLPENPIFHYSNTPSLQWVRLNGLNYLNKFISLRSWQTPNI
jgi:hypothetical protein